MSQSLLETNVHEAVAALESLLPLQEPLERAGEAVLEALNSGHKLLVCGNGGSAADAMHLATEFVCRFCEDRRPYPAICLNASGADLTAIGNDYAFSDAFARQVQAFGAPGDVLLAFSTSGNSENVRRAIEAAERGGLTAVAFLGRDGGATRGLASLELIVDHPVTARIQEAHKLLLHTICQQVERGLAKA